MKDQEQANRGDADTHTERPLGVMPESDTATITALHPIGWVEAPVPGGAAYHLCRRYYVEYMHDGLTHALLVVDLGHKGLARTFADAVRQDVERARYVDSAFPAVIAALPLEVTL